MIKVQANEEVIAERTLWSEPGNTISGVIVIDVPENTTASAVAAEHEGQRH